MIKRVICSFILFLMNSIIKGKKWPYTLYAILCKFSTNRYTTFNTFFQNNRYNNEYVQQVISKLSKISVAKRNSILLPAIETTIFGTKNKFRICFIEITNKCNLRCKYCLNGDIQNSIMVSPDDLLYRIKEAAKYVKIFIITGGEPLLNDSLFGIIRKNPSLLFIVFTNGTLLTDRVLSDISEIGNLIFCVSIDATESAHEANRGKETYMKAISCVGNIKKYGFACGISTVVNELNIDSIIEGRADDSYEKTGADFLILMCENCHDRNSLYRRYNAMSENCLSISTKIPTISFPFFERHLDNHSCMGGKVIFHIDCYGNVSMCPFSSHNCGSLNEFGLSDIIGKMKSETLCKCAYWNYMEGDGDNG